MGHYVSKQTLRITSMPVSIHGLSPASSPVQRRHSVGPIKHPALGTQYSANHASSKSIHNTSSDYSPRHTSDYHSLIACSQKNLNQSIRSELIKPASPNISCWLIYRRCRSGEHPFRDNKCDPAVPYVPCVHIVTFIPFLAQNTSLLAQITSFDQMSLIVPAAALLYHQRH